MDSLITLLRHPYIVVSKVAQRIYGVQSNATYERLRSRVTERHRFKEEEYQKLTTLFEEIQEVLSAQVKALQHAQKYPDTPKTKEFLQDLHHTLGHECLQLKAFLLDVGGQTEKDYYRMYDLLRERRTLTNEHLAALEKQLADFVFFIGQQLKTAKKEAKRYQFSAGRGQHSHVLDN